MNSVKPFDLREITKHFRLRGKFLRGSPVRAGHINDTYASCFLGECGIIRYIHQRINHEVFKEPEKLMENIERVTRYARERIQEAGGDAQRETLNLVPTVEDGSYCRTPEGDYWRSYVFIEGARTYDRAENLDHVYSAAKAFGKFQKLLSGLPGERLHETIPFFHHTRRRFDAFCQACGQDSRNRAGSVRAEIDFVLKREAETSVIIDLLEQGKIPERVTHNDTKLNNVMIDLRTGEGVCVIDLDTVMPGSALYDFGDSVRIGASSAAEDERDLTKVGLDLERFDCLARGYLDAAREFLTPAEINLMAFSAKLMTFECGVRFLTDHLNGDTYFKIQRDNHNLDRCRTQFKMVAEMEWLMDRMNGIIEACR
jgi:hypothetical protein